MANLQDIDKLIEGIRNGKPKSFYLFFGDQDYLVKQAYDRVCEALVPPENRDFNFEQYDGAQVEVSEIGDAFNTLPMMPGSKVVGIPDCRFFLSKKSGGDLLSKARQAWESKETNAALRHLAKAVALAGQTWKGCVGWTLEDFKETLGADAVDSAKHGGEWLMKALAQGLSADFPMPGGGDDSGQLLTALETSLAQGCAEQHLVVSAPTADARKKLYKFFQKNGAVLDFRAAAKAWQATQTAGVFLKNILRQKSIEIDFDTSQRLLTAWAKNLGQLVKEVDKMEAYAYPRKNLGGQDLEAVGSPRPEEDVFKLIDVLAEKKIGQALPLLRQQLQDDAALAVFGRIAGEIRNLVLARAVIDVGLLPSSGPRNYANFKAEQHKKLELKLPLGLRETWARKHPYPLFNSLQRAGRYSMEHLKAMLIFAHEAELQLKGSGRDPGAILEELCVRFCGVEEEAFL